MLRRVAISGYKSLREVKVQLAPLTIFFGANATGKSNLFDALSLLSRMCTRENLTAAFDEREHRGAPLEAFHLPEGGLDQLQQLERAELSLEADVELSQAVIDAVEAEVQRAREGLPGQAASRRKSVTERRLRYRVTVEVRPATGHLRVIDERLEALRADWAPVAGRRKPFIEYSSGDQRLVLRMEKQGHPTYEELGQDRTIVSKRLYPPHFPHITAFREELARWRFYFLEPSAMRATVPVKEVETLASDGGDLAAFYNTQKERERLQFDAVSRTLHQVVQGVTAFDVVRDRQGLVHLEVDEAGLPISSRLISDGTLRILGLLAITTPLRPLSMVAYEEPENGIQPARLSMVARILSNAVAGSATQFLVNTHSPILPDHFVAEPDAQLVLSKKSGRETVFELPDPLFAATKVDEFDAEAPSLREVLVRGDLTS